MLQVSILVYTSEKDSFRLKIKYIPVNVFCLKLLSTVLFRVVSFFVNI